MEFISEELAMKSEFWELPGKWSYSACSSGTGRFYGYRTQHQDGMCRSSKRTLLLSVLFKHSSMAYNDLAVRDFHHMGIKPSEIFDDQTVSKPIILAGFSRNANGTSVEVTVNRFPCSLNSGA